MTPRQVLKINSYPIFATRPYDDLAAHIIGGVKDHQRRWLLPFLEEGVMSAVRPLVVASDCAVTLVPMPSRASSVRRRGEDLMVRICHQVARRLRSEHQQVDVQPLLRHQRRVRDQAGLSARQRQANLDGAFELSKPPVAGRKIIVVDDVVTTGASMREAMRVLARYELMGGASATSTTF